MSNYLTFHKFLLYSLFFLNSSTCPSCLPSSVSRYSLSTFAGIFLVSLFFCLFSYLLLLVFWVPSFKDYGTINSLCPPLLGPIRRITPCSFNLAMIRSTCLSERGHIVALIHYRIKNSWFNYQISKSL